MLTPSGSWSTQQLTEFLAAVSSCPDEAAAVRAAVERAAEALESEVGAVVRAGTVVTAIGFGSDQVPEKDLLAASGDADGALDLEGLGPCETAVALIEGSPTGRLLVARSGEGFSPEERNLLRGMGRVLALTLRQFHALAEERRLRAELEERQKLLEQLSRVQRAIANRAPLRQVLDAVTAGAAELLEAEVVGLRVLDADDPRHLLLMSSSGLQPELAKRLWRTPADSGLSGRAIVEEALVCADGPRDSAGALGETGERPAEAAMAAPVRESGRVVGSLLVVSYHQGRSYSAEEQSTLVSFADQVSLALTDAKTVASVHQAFHDGLTGMPNRALFLDRLEHGLARAREDQAALAVLFVDLDRFKLVNDTLGHSAGDQLLVAAGERLRATVGEADTAARFGGNEFAILLEDEASAQRASRVAERVIDELRAPFDLDGREVYVSASVGIAVSHDGREEAAELLRNADVAMYRAKQRGSGQYDLFEPGMRAALVERLELESDLQRAVEQEEFTLVYQPIVSLEQGVVRGVEALLRWSHPTRGVVGPLRFVPLAEENGLIVPIGRWALQAACRQAVRWQREYPADPPRTMSVNLSARQLQQSGLVPEVANALEVSGLDPNCLVLEITESVVVQDVDATITKLRALKQLGIRIAIDDFGTGYSSLSYLRQLPVDVLKIDKSFVDGIADDPEAAALARAIVGMASTLSLRVVAEGIEKPDQLDELRRMGCELGQGYLFAKPLEAAEVARLLRRGAVAAVATLPAT